MTKINKLFNENIENVLTENPQLQVLLDTKSSKEEWLENAHEVFAELYSAIKNKEHISILKYSAELSIISENAFSSFGEIENTCYDCIHFSGYCTLMGNPANKFDIACDSKEKTN